MSKLINVTHVKQYLMDYASKTRHHKFTQVSQTTLDRIEAAVRSTCKSIVTSAPSKGKKL